MTDYKFDANELIPLAKQRQRSAESVMTISINKSGAGRQYGLRVGFHGELAEAASHYSKARILVHPKRTDGMFIDFRAETDSRRNGWFKLQNRGGLHFQFTLSDSSEKLVRRRYVGRRYTFDVVSQDEEEGTLMIFAKIEETEE